MSNLSNPHSQRKDQDIENQKQMIEQDRNEMDQTRRFGYFSIPYPATVGDLAYTTTKEKKNYKIIDVDGVRCEFEDGWALVRASNTGPNLTLRFEANSHARLNEIQSEFEGKVTDSKNKYIK